MAAILILAVFLALMIYAAGHDVMTMTIPNHISIALVALFPFAALVSGLTLVEAGWHLAVFTATFAVAVALFALKVFGGGDAKLLSATALFIGPAAMSPFVMGIAVCGGALTLVIIIARRLAPVTEPVGPWMPRSLVDGQGVPYGVAITAGAFLAIPSSPLLAGLGAAFL